MYNIFYTLLLRFEKAQHSYLAKMVLTFPSQAPVIRLLSVSTVEIVTAVLSIVINCNIENVSLFFECTYWIAFLQKIEKVLGIKYLKEIIFIMSREDKGKSQLLQKKTYEVFLFY